MAPKNGAVSSKGSSTEEAAKETKKTPIGKFASFEEFTKHALGEVVAATKASNAFPQGTPRDLYCSYPTFGRIIDERSHRIMGLISTVLKNESVKGNIQWRQSDEQFDMLLEGNDIILERVNCNLDELAGVKKTLETVIIEARMANISPTPTSGAGSWNLKKNSTSPVTARLITAKNIERPQLKFKVPVDNSSRTPFIPKLKEKPNSLKPLAILPEYNDDGNIESYLHPYEFELMKFEVSDKQLYRREPEHPPLLNETIYVIVNQVSQLKTVVEEIKQHKEIAIDVEHHSYRTYLGFTCLVQISTRDKDYLFDALALRDDMHVLNEFLTDSKIVKIFHGADQDVEWLQRDLSLYVVNMFDTHQAAKALRFARLSLSYLLKHYCNIEADKTFQLADWRIRPLPEELIEYARQDTHFLIYIFERITNDLLDAAQQKTNLLRTVYQNSTELCKKRYVKPIKGPDAHMDLFRKSKRAFDNRQLFALREIYQWRDEMARQEDESVGYVLPNHMMLQIAESLPREMQGIMACCNPIPPMVRQHLHTLHQILLRAREQPLINPILEIDTMHRVGNSTDIDYSSKLHCPHDLSHNEELHDDLPTLLKFSDEDKDELTNQLAPSLEIQMSKPKLTVYAANEEIIDDEEAQQKALAQSLKFISPYQRYIAMLPLVEKEMQEEARRMDAKNKTIQLCPSAEILPLEVAPADVKVKAEDELYSLPVKEFLKRKHEEAIAKKTEQGSDTPKAKRARPGTSPKTLITPNDDKLNFNRAPMKKENQQTATPALKSENPNIVVIDDDSDGPEEMPSTSQTQKMAYLAQNNNKQSNKRKQNGNRKNGKKKGKFQKQEKAQSSNTPVSQNFDYKNVNFKKFTGGAQRFKGTVVNQVTKPKGNSNKAKNKKFNKLFNFSNGKGKKK